MSIIVSRVIGFVVRSPLVGVEALIFGAFDSCVRFSTPFVFISSLVRNTIGSLFFVLNLFASSIIGRTITLL
jgi:hypothetical protein